MKASELIKELQNAVEKYGDNECYVANFYDMCFTRKTAESVFTSKTDDGDVPIIIIKH